MVFVFTSWELPFEPNIIVSDKNLVQLLTVYRIFNEDVELSISTQESEKFRNIFIP